MKTAKMTTLGAIIALTAILTGCSTIAAIQTKTLTKTLPDGSTLHYNTNVVPTPDWGCTTVGAPQSYDWGTIQIDSQFSYPLSGPYGMLLDKGINYLTANNLKANYMNMAIPTTTSVITSSTSRSTTSEDVTENDNVVLGFHNCQVINPDHQVGATEEKSSSIQIGGE